MLGQSSSYPYNDPDPVILKKYTDSIDRASQLSDIIREHQSVSPARPFLSRSFFCLTLFHPFFGSLFSHLISHLMS